MKKGQLVKFHNNSAYPHLNGTILIFLKRKEQFGYYYCPNYKSKIAGWIIQAFDNRKTRKKRNQFYIEPID